jgi:hypothetical protein
MNQEYCQEFKPTVWYKLGKFLFPYSPRPHIEGDERTYLTTNIYIHVDWLDRLRLLISGKAHIVVVTYTDIEVKEAESVSSFEVQAL